MMFMTTCDQTSDCLKKKKGQLDKSEHLRLQLQLWSLSITLKPPITKYNVRLMLASFLTNLTNDLLLDSQ